MHHSVTFRVDSKTFGNYFTSSVPTCGVVSETIAPGGPWTDGSCEFEHAIVESEDGRECTIYPVQCDPDDIVTQWVTAGEGSFVPVAEIR